MEIVSKISPGGDLMSQKLTSDGVGLLVELETLSLVSSELSLNTCQNLRLLSKTFDIKGTFNKVRSYLLNLIRKTGSQTIEEWHHPYAAKDALLCNCWESHSFLNLLWTEMRKGLKFSLLGVLWGLLRVNLKIGR